MKNLRALCSTAILAATLPSSACRTSADTTISATSTTYDRSPMGHLGGSRSWQLRVSGQRSRLDQQANVYILAGPGKRATITDLATGRIARLDMAESTVVYDDLRAHAESIAVEIDRSLKRWPPRPQPETRLLMEKTSERRRVAGFECERWLARWITPPFDDGTRPRAPAWSLMFQDMWVATDHSATQEIAEFCDRATRHLPSLSEARDRILDELGAFLIEPRSVSAGCGARSSDLRKALGRRPIVRALTVSALQPSEEDLGKLVSEDRVGRLGEYVWGAVGYRSIMNAVDSLFGESAMETIEGRERRWPGPHTGVTMVSTWSLDDMRRAPLSPDVFVIPSGLGPPKGCDCCVPPVVPVKKQ